MSYENIDIKVENISKLYRIGAKEQIHDSFGRAMFEFIKSPLNNYRKYRSLYKFDDVEPGNENKKTNNSNDVIWALKNVSFNVKKGEVLGIIGANGAGKSTLLKILSNITNPTKGRAEIRGKVASLLEVGTGFHPELTGRENVYLNGTILGMTRKEVKQRFDEIVDFSGVEKFIDTPVKRYSSGMKVRLAFSVAAHLETDILLVDEVLAVGDASFQQKCMGKMGEVSKGGRTILLVSHNMGAIDSICKRVILFSNGKIIYSGNPNDAIETYYNMSANRKFEINDGNLSKIQRSQKFTPVILRARINDKPLVGNMLLKPNSPFKMEIVLRLSQPMSGCTLGIHFESILGQIIFASNTRWFLGKIYLNKAGFYYFRCKIPAFPLIPDKYFLSVGFSDKRGQVDWIDKISTIEVANDDIYGTGEMPYKGQGYFLSNAQWTFNEAREES